MRIQIFVPQSASAAGGLCPDPSAIEQIPFRGHEGDEQQPLDLYLASLGTCASLYALRFCRGRDLDTTGMSVEVTSDRGRELSRLSAIRIQIHLPVGFPESYREAIARAAGQCKFKRHVLAPPRFEIKAVPAQSDGLDLGEYEQIEIGA